jgi:hypothetical protein
MLVCTYCVPSCFGHGSYLKYCTISNSLSVTHHKNIRRAKIWASSHVTEPTDEGRNVTHLLIRQLFWDYAVKSPLLTKILACHKPDDETKILSGVSQSPRGDESFEIVKYSFMFKIKFKLHLNIERTDVSECRLYMLEFGGVAVSSTSRLYSDQVGLMDQHEVCSWQAMNLL